MQGEGNLRCTPQKETPFNIQLKKMYTSIENVFHPPNKIFQ